MTTTKIIGEDLTIISYLTKQRGYGRQSLYVSFLEIDGEIYIQDVYPNVEEHFDILLVDDAYLNEETGKYTNSNDNGSYSEEDLYDDIEDALNRLLNGCEVEVDEDEDEENY